MLGSDLGRLARYWRSIVGCGLIAAAVAYLVSANQPKTYEAKATLEVSDVDFTSLFLSQTGVSRLDRQRVTATNAALVSLPSVRARAARDLGTSYDSERLEDVVTVESQANTDLIDVFATDGSPTQAAKIANAMVRAFVATRAEGARRALESAQTRIERQLAGLSAEARNSETGRDLEDRLRQVGVAAATATGDVTPVEDAQVPDTAIGPHPFRNGVLGIIVGSLFGAFVALLRLRLDNTVREFEELDRLWPIPEIGVISLDSGSSPRDATLRDPSAIEGLTMARTNLRYLTPGGEARAILMTSSVAGEGKTTVTWNLGVVAAMSGQRVIVVEADMRRPVLAQRLASELREDLSDHGLSDVLAGLCDANTAIRTMEVPAVRMGAPTVLVDLLPAGTVPPHPTGLLEHARMAALLGELRANHDLILVDTPPAPLVADALSIVNVCDGVVIVSRIDVATRSAVSRLRDMMLAIEAPVLGRINNGAPRPHEHDYGYGPYVPSPPPVTSRA